MIRTISIKSGDDALEDDLTDDELHLALRCHEKYRMFCEQWPRLSMDFESWCRRYEGDNNGGLTNE